MKRRTALKAAAAAGLLGPLLAPARASAAPATPGQEVTWPEVTLLDGTRLDGGALKSRPVVAVFWSTTCPFCRRHNQHVEKLHRVAAARGLLVLGIARDRDAEKVRSYARAQGYTFPITMDHAPLAAALSSRNVIPLTVTVDRQGRLRQVIPGEMFEEDVLELARLAG